MPSLKCYKPGVNSPIEPMVASIVLYRMAKNTPDVDAVYPAIVTKVWNTEDDRVNLTVFTGVGILHVTRVPFSADHNMPNSWDNAQEPKRRPIELSDDKVPEPEVQTTEA